MKDCLAEVIGSIGSKIKEQASFFAMQIGPKIGPTVTTLGSVQVFDLMCNRVGFYLPALRITSDWLLGVLVGHYALAY